MVKTALKRPEREHNSNSKESGSCSKWKRKRWSKKWIRNRTCKLKQLTHFSLGCLTSKDSTSPSCRTNKLKSSSRTNVKWQKQPCRQTWASTASKRIWKASLREMRSNKIDRNSTGLMRPDSNTLTVQTWTSTISSSDSDIYHLTLVA